MAKENAIKAYIVAGFLEAGKTTYIQDTLKYDYFYKRGKTLILAMEEGEEEWDEEFLLSRNTHVEIYEGSENITAFCNRCIEIHNPDRIYIEDNAMLGDIQETIPDIMQIVDKTVIIDGRTLKNYWHNMKSIFMRLLEGASLVIFNRVTDEVELGTYGTSFRMINNNANYLTQSALGYHEKAFGNSLEYSLEGEYIVIKEKDYPSFFLDSLEYPQNYRGKSIVITATVEKPKNYPDGYVCIGEKVMVCCAADMQFLGVPVRVGRDNLLNQGERRSISGEITTEDPEFPGRIVIIYDDTDMPVPCD